MDQRNYSDARTAFVLHPFAPLENSTQYIKRPRTHFHQGGVYSNTSFNNVQDYGMGLSTHYDGIEVKPPSLSARLSEPRIVRSGKGVIMTGRGGSTTYAKSKRVGDVLYSYEAGRNQDTVPTSIKRSRHMLADINAPSKVDVLFHRPGAKELDKKTFMTRKDEMMGRLGAGRKKKMR